MPRLPQIGLRKHLGRTYALILIAIAGLGWAAYATLHATRPIETLNLRLYAGSPVERRLQIGQHLAEEADEAQLAISLVPARNLDELLTKFATHEIDAAIVSLGLNVRDIDHIQALAGLDTAPLHILVRREITTSSSSLIETFKHRRINLGQPGSNDHALGLEVMDFLRLGDHYTAMNWTKDELVHRADEVVQASPENRAALAQDMPDVAMVVASLPSNVVQRLLDTELYELVAFPYAKNFLMSDSRNRKSELNRRYVEPATVPAAMYVSNTPIPAQDCPSIGLRSLLVAHADLPEATVWRLMKTVFESGFAHLINPLPPNKIVDSVQVHSAATTYLERKKPLLTGDFFEQFSDGLSIFGAFIAGALSLYSYLRRRRIRSPGEYLEEIRNVDSLVCRRDSETGELKPPAVIARELDSRLVKLKEKLIEDYCNNRVQGELVLMTILSMLSDSRAQLQRSTGHAHQETALDQSHKNNRSQAA